MGYKRIICRNCQEVTVSDTNGFCSWNCLFDYCFENAIPIDSFLQGGSFGMSDVKAVVEDLKNSIQSAINNLDNIESDLDDIESNIDHIDRNLKLIK